MPATKRPTKTNKLKFSSVSGRKKIMFITLLAFVVVGVGIIIKSFAATGNSVYTRSNGYLNATNTSTVLIEPVGKNTLPVVALNVYGEAKVSGPGQILIPAGQKFQACATESGGQMNNQGKPGGLTVEFINNYVGSSYSWTIDDRHPGAQVGNGYVEYCSDVIGRGIPGAPPADLTGPILLVNGGKTVMKISDFTLKFVETTTATPAPTK